MHTIRLIAVVLFLICTACNTQEIVETAKSNEFIYFVSRDVKTENEELNYVDLRDNTIHKCSISGGINYFDIADDSSFIAYNRFQLDGTHPELYLFQIKSRTEKLIDTIGYIVQVSPSNKWIAYRTNNDVIISDTSGNNKQVLLKGGENPDKRIYYKSPVWSNDGEFIYFNLISRTTDSTIISLKRISVKTKLVENIANNFNGRFLKIAGHTNDEVFAYEQSNNGKRFEENIVRFKKNQSNKWTKEVVLNGGSDVFDVSPDGKNIVFMKDSVIQDTIRYGWHLFVYDIEKKKTKQITFGALSCDWPVWKKFN